jgi:hypothetical protein
MESIPVGCVKLTNVSFLNTVKIWLEPWVHLITYFHARGTADVTRQWESDRSHCISKLVALLVSRLQLRHRVSSCRRPLFSRRLNHRHIVTASVLLSAIAEDKCTKLKITITHQVGQTHPLQLK